MKRTRSQKFLAFVMSVLLAFTTFAGDFNTLTATAAGSASGNPSVSTEADGVQITKSAKVTGDQAEITFTVVGTNKTQITTTTNEAAIVFVMDLSNSMLYGDSNSTANNYNNTRLKKAKDAAKEFASAQNGLMKDSHVSVGVVTYGTNAYVDTELTKSAAAVATAIDNIGKKQRETNESSVGNGNNTYYAAGGTNVQAGIKKAADMLAKSDAKVKAIVLLSDGEPTYNYEVTGQANSQTTLNDGSKKYLYTFNYNRTEGAGSSQTYSRKTGSGCNRSYVTLDSGIAAISEAQFAKNNGISIYSVAYNVNNGSTAASVMSNIATKNTSDNTYSYLASSNGSVSNAIATVLKSISTSISAEVAAATGTQLVDILPDYMSMTQEIQLPETLTVVEANGAAIDYANGTLTWDLGDLGKGVEKSITIVTKLDIEKMIEEYADAHKMTVEAVRQAMADGGVEFNLNELVSFTYKDSNGNNKENTAINATGTATGNVGVPTDIFEAHPYTITYYVDGAQVASKSGNAFETESIAIGDCAEYTSNPEKFASKKVLVNNVEVTAQNFTMGESKVTVNVYYVTKTFQVEFQVKNENGDYVKYVKEGFTNPQTVKYGESATAPEDVIGTYYDKDGYRYTAKGWDSSFANVTENKAVKAVYDDGTRLNYDVTFKALNPTTGKLEKYGETYKVPTNTAMGDNFPSNPADVTGGIAERLAKKTFDKWVLEGTDTVVDVDKDYVFTDDATVVAVYNDVVKTFTVEFYDLADKKIADQTVEYGKKATPIAYTGTDPYIGKDAVYFFNGWDFDFNTAITKDTAIKAKKDKTADLYYTVKWMNGNDPVASNSDVLYGTDAAFNGTNPTKAEDATYTYTFLGWNTDKDATEASNTSGNVENVTGDVTLYAIFKAEYKTYTYYFEYKDAYGETLTTTVKSYHYGDLIDEAPEVPENYKVTAEGRETVYTFSGSWTYDNATLKDGKYYITGSGKATAQYDGVTTYTVTFDFNNGKDSEVSQTVTAGEKVSSVPTASKAADWENTYAFENWICGETTYTAAEILELVINEPMKFFAQYTPTANKYKLPVEVYVDGVKKSGELFTNEVEFGGSVSYTLNISDWTPEGKQLHLDKVTLGEAALTANFVQIGTETYNKTIRYYLVEDAKYTVTYNNSTMTQSDDKLDYTWSAVKSTEFGKSEGVYSGKEFTKPADVDSLAEAYAASLTTAKNTYKFVGWFTADGEAFTATTLTSDDVEVFAKYVPEIRTYTITYVDDVLTAPAAETVKYGTTKELTKPATPADTVEHDYTGNDYWTVNGATVTSITVTGDVTVTAVHESKAQVYDVVFYDEDGKEVSKTSQEYGTAVSAASSEGLSKNADDRYTYSFGYWTDMNGNKVDWDNVKVTGKMEFKAYYAPTEKEFYVTFIDDNADNTVLDTEKAVWNNDNDGFYVVGKAAKVAADASAAARSNTVNTYSFSKWLKDDAEFSFATKITDNISVKAVYTYVTSKYTVTYHEEDGTVLKEVPGVLAGQNYALNDITGPDKASSVSTDYTFAGWSTVKGDKDCLVTSAKPLYIDGDKDVYAVYDESVRKYTVTFMNEGDEFGTTTGVAYGTSVNDVQVPTGTPTKAQTVDEKTGEITTYSFKGWDYGNKITVDGNIIANATYSETKHDMLAITATPVEVTYDGADHGITITVPKGVTVVKYTYDGTDYTSVDKLPGFVNAGSYEVKVLGTYEVEGQKYNTLATATVKINKAQLTVETASGSKSYDGNALTATGQITGFVNGEENGVEFSVTGTQTNVGYSTNGYSIKYESTNADNYYIVEELGTLTVTPASAELSVEGYAGTYDGKAHGIAEITISVPEGNPETKDDFDLSYSLDNENWSNEAPTITEVGDFIVYVKASNKNYNEIVADCTLKVNPAKATVEATGFSGKYDGNNHGLASINVTVPEGNPETEFTFTYSVDGENWVSEEPTVKNVSDKPSTFMVKASNANYEAAVATYTVTINPRELGIYSVSNKKVYDGTALTNSTTKVTGDGFVEGEGYTAQVTGSQTEVGMSKNGFTYTLNEGTLEANYVITKTEGMLIVTKASADEYTLTAEGFDGQYDGEEHKGTITTNLEEEYKLSYSVNGGEFTEEVPTVKNVGEELKVTVKLDTKNYSSKTAEYTLKVSKREVTVTSEGASKTYDGTALTKEAASVTEGSFVDKYEFAFTGTQTNAGSSDNVVSVVFADENAAANYKITYVYGKLTVNQAKVTIAPEENGKMYGQEDPELGAKVLGWPEAGAYLNYSLEREEGEDAGSYELYVVFDPTQNPNYEIVALKNIFEITPAEAIAYFENYEKEVIDFSKIYGEADPSFKVLFEGLLEGDDVSYRVLRAPGENVGEYKVWIEVFGHEEPADEPIVVPIYTPQMSAEETPAQVVFEHIAKEDKSNNYWLAAVNIGKLTINKLSVVVEGGNYSMDEDEARPYSWPYSINKTLPFGDDLGVYTYIWGVSDQSVTPAAGTYAIVPVVGASKEVTDNYDITVRNGELVVNKVIEEIPPVIPTEEGNPPTGNNPPEDNNPPAENPPAENPPEVEIPEEPVPETPEIPEEPVVEPEPVVEVEPEVVEIEPEPVPEAPARCIIHWFILADTLLYALYAALRIVNNAKELKGETKEAEE